MDPYKCNRMTTLPRLLCLQLKRFAIAFHAGSLFAEQTYLTHHVACEETIQIHGSWYRILATVYHEGVALHNGHYYTLCRHQHSQGEWWYYNDTVRRAMRSSDVSPAGARIYVCGSMRDQLISTVSLRACVYSPLSTTCSGSKRSEHRAQQ